MNLKGLAVALLLAFTPAQAAAPIHPNHFRFSADIDAANVIQAMRVIDKMGHRYKYILMEINSSGGDIDAGFELAKAIENSPVPIVCVVDGEADSMAFYILQSCHMRLMTTRSTLLIHKPSTVFNNCPVRGNDEFYAQLANRLHKWSQAMTQHYANHMKVSAKFIARKIRYHDWVLNADEALKVGAVDGTITAVSDVYRVWPTIDP